MSPEILDPDRFGPGDSRPTKHSDCYALGMVILEVLTGVHPFPNYNNLIVTSKIVEGKRPGRPEGEEGVWFTNDLWEMLERCWSPQPERRPAIDAVLQCLRRGSTTWRPLPPDSGDRAQSDSDDRSDFTLGHSLGIEPSAFLHLFLNLTHPQTPFVVDWIDSWVHDRAPVLSRNQPHSVYAGQGSYQHFPGSQQRLAELPVSAMSDMTDMLSSYDNPWHTLVALQFHQCETSRTSAIPRPFQPIPGLFHGVNHQLNIILRLQQTTFSITDLLYSCSRTQWKRVPPVS